MDVDVPSQRIVASGSDLPRAENVCVYCRRRKTKCDKRLPSCLPCQKHNVECVYEDPASNIFVDELRYLRRRLKDVERLAVHKTFNNAHPARLASGDPPNSALEITKHGTFLKRLEAVKTETDLSEEVHDLAQSKPGELYGACQVYFQNVHTWMPIMSQRLFYKRMTEFSKTKRADFSLLLLCICLLVRYPSSDTTHDPLYKIVKTEYGHLNSHLEATIEMAQAGILIACYEHASGLVEASYYTIGLCARMGYWMGLQNQRLESNLPRDSDAWLENAERCNTWWGICIRDRCINIEETALGKPFAVQRSSIPMYLPLDSDTLDASFTALPATNAIGIFGRVAQACILLDQAICLHQREDTAQQEARSEEVGRLDAEIRQLLWVLIEQNGGTLCAYCEASAMVIAALFVLHSGNSHSIPPATDLDADNNNCNAATTKSSLARKTAGRIVIDVARSFNNCLGEIGSATLSPTYCYIIYRAIQELIAINDGRDRVQLFQDLEVLRETCWHYGRRWQMAARHLISADKAITGILLAPPSTFCSFEPLRNHHCLISLFDE